MLVKVLGGTRGFTRQICGTACEKRGTLPACTSKIVSTSLKVEAFESLLDLPFCSSEAKTSEPEYARTNQPLNWTIGILSNCFIASATNRAQYAAIALTRFLRCNRQCALDVNYIMSQEQLMRQVLRVQEGAMCLCTVDICEYPGPGQCRASS